MVLDAADSTVGGMLSLNVNANRWRGGASSSRSCALVMNCGAGTMQEDHTRSLLKSQGSSRSCRQDTALGVHCLPLRLQRGGGLEEEPGGRAGPRSKIQTKPSYCILCSPCHVHHKSVGGRLLKTRPRPATVRVNVTICLHLQGRGDTYEGYSTNETSQPRVPSVRSATSVRMSALSP